MSESTPSRRARDGDADPATLEQAASRRLRIGILTPSSNTVLEPTSVSLLAPIKDQVSAHFTRIPVTTISDAANSRRQFRLAPMLGAAQLLADARVDAILWGGTSGTWEGIDGDRRLVGAIRDATAIPATTATLGLINAFEALAVRRYGLIVPYLEPIAEEIASQFDKLGYDCVAKTFESLTTNWEFGSVPPSTLIERAEAIASHRPDAIVISCTNLRGAEIVEELERDLGVPIFDSVIVGIWATLDMLGVPAPTVGFGRLGRLGTTGRSTSDA